MSAAEREGFLQVKDSAFGHPKFIALGNIMGWHQCMARGVMEEFWHIVQVRIPDGVFTDIATPEVIASALPVRMSKQAIGKFVRALFTLRFLDGEDNGTAQVHDWKDHGGKREAAKQRASEAGKASAEARRASAGSSTDDQTSGQHPFNDCSNDCSTTVPTRNQQSLEVRETTKLNVCELRAGAREGDSPTATAALPKTDANAPGSPQTGPPYAEAGTTPRNAPAGTESRPAARVEGEAVVVPRDLVQIAFGCGWTNPEPVVASWLRDGHPPDEIRRAIVTASQRKGVQPVTYAGGILRNRAKVHYAPEEAAHEPEPIARPKRTRTVGRDYAD